MLFAMDSLFNAFSKLTPEELTDRKILSRIVHFYCGFHYRTLVKKELWKEQEGSFFSSFHHSFKIKQNPKEIVDLLILLHQHKADITSYLEVGSCTGGTFYLIDSYLRAINPNYIKGVMIDLKEPLRLEEYKALFPATAFVKQDSKQYRDDFFYSFCLIDGDHSYEGVRADWLNFKNMSRFFAFHDILHPKYPGVGKFWNELKIKHSKGQEVVDNNWELYFTKPIGIGFLDRWELKGVE